MQTNHEQEMRKKLLESSFSWPGKLIILAGHFMVLYRPMENRLVPIIKSSLDLDPGATNLEKEYAAEVGYLPEKSFNLAVEIVKSRPTGSTSIVVLIDDHQFKRVQRLGPNEVSASARRELFLSENSLPAPFKDSLDRKNISVEVLEVSKFGPSRRDSLLFSEISLQRQFARHTKKQLAAYRGFSFSGSPLGARQFFYRDAELDRGSCVLDENNEPTCSATALQLMIEMSLRGAQSILLFVPYVCRDQVSAASFAALSSLNLFNNSWVISGSLPGDDGNVDITKAFVLASEPAQ